MIQPMVYVCVGSRLGLLGKWKMKHKQQIANTPAQCFALCNVLVHSFFSDKEILIETDKTRKKKKISGKFTAAVLVLFKALSEIRKKKWGISVISSSRVCSQNVFFSSLCF